MELRVWYHCALMPGWQPIVTEQLRLAAAAGLPRMKACVLGEPLDTFLDLANACGSQVDLVYHSKNFGEYEHPTLCRLWQAAHDHQEDAFLYWHTKGVSKPREPHRQQARRLIHKWTVWPWRDNLKLLEEFDTVGVNWRAGRRFYAGNCWLARGDWLRRLPDPVRYRRNPPLIHTRPWARTHCEHWLHSIYGGKLKSLLCRNRAWHYGSRIFRASADIEGFSYL